MTVFTNVAPQIIYGDILTCTNGGQGLSVAQTNLQDALGNNSPILIATTSVNFSRGIGQFQLDGVAVTATSVNINSMCQPNPIALGNGALQLPSGTTGQRPGVPQLGNIRFNITTNTVEYYIGGGNWTADAGGTVTSVTGTAGQINVASGTTTPVLSLDSNLTNIDSVTSSAILHLNGAGVSLIVGGAFIDATAIALNLKANTTLDFFNAANSFSASFSGANISSNASYYLPAGYPSINNQAMTSDTAGTMSWSSVQLMATVNQLANNTLTTNSKNIVNGGGVLSLLLPTASIVGDVIKIVGNLNGWIVTQRAGQTVHFLAANTTTGVGGSLASTLSRNCVELTCVTANTDFVVSNHEGTLTVT